MLVMILSSLSLIYNNLFVLTGILVVSMIISILMKSDIIAILVRVRKIIGLLIIIAIIQSVFTKAGQPILRIKGITILTDYGANRSLEFVLRMSIIIVTASIISTSSSREIVQGLVQWHCPYEIAFMVSVAIRFLPVFKEEMTDMVTAIQLRGIDLKKVKLKEKITVYKYLLLPIITNSILKAKELSTAMEARAFRAYPTRTSYMVLKMQKHDYIIMGTSILATIIFVIATS
jgi:energy-coupling factor transport system permease protein